MLALMDTKSRLEVDATIAGGVRITACSETNFEIPVVLNVEQVETLYTQLGRWLGGSNPFVSDVV